MPLDMKNLTDRGVYEFRLYGDDGNDKLLGVSMKYYFGNKPGTQLTDFRRRELGDTSKPADISKMVAVSDRGMKEDGASSSLKKTSSFSTFDVSFDSTEASSEVASHLLRLFRQTNKFGRDQTSTADGSSDV